MNNEMQNLEFVVSDSVQRLVGVMDEVLRETSFSTKESRYARNTSKHQKYQVFLTDQSTAELHPCGWIEFLENKRNKTIVRMKLNFQMEPGALNDGQVMDRLFYLYVQRLVQLGVIDTPTHSL